MIGLFLYLGINISLVVGKHEHDADQLISFFLCEKFFPK